MDDDQHQKSGRTAGAGFRSRVSPFGPDLSPGGFSWLRSRLLWGFRESHKLSALYLGRLGSWPMNLTRMYKR